MRVIQALLPSILALALAIGGGVAAAWLTLSTPARDKAGWTAADAQEALAPAGWRVPGRPFALPLGRNEGAAFIAGLDGKGDPLRSECDYRVSGRFPPSQLWTLVARERGNPVAASMLNAFGTLLEPDGAEAVIVSRHPNAGNWLALKTTGPITLTLSLYGSAVDDGTGFTDLRLPRIETLRCDG